MSCQLYQWTSTDSCILYLQAVYLQSSLLHYLAEKTDTLKSVNINWRLIQSKSNLSVVATKLIIDTYPVIINSYSTLHVILCISVWCKDARRWCLLGVKKTIKGTCIVQSKRWSKDDSYCLKRWSKDSPDIVKKDVKN